MQPARLNLRINQGATLRKPLLMMQPVYEYKPITAIQATAPLLLTVNAHGLAGDWPIWIEGVTGWGALPSRQGYRRGYLGAERLQRYRSQRYRRHACLPAACRPDWLHSPHVYP